MLKKSNYLERYGTKQVAMIPEKIIRYRSLFEASEGRTVWLCYVRQKVKMQNGPRFNNWVFTGKVIKVNKKSMLLLLNNEQKVNIGFRGIKESVFLDACYRIKRKLYYD